MQKYGFTSPLTPTFIQQKDKRHTQFFILRIIVPSAQFFMFKYGMLGIETNTVYTYHTKIWLYLNMLCLTFKLILIFSDCTFCFIEIVFQD